MSGDRDWSDGDKIIKYNLKITKRAKKITLVVECNDEIYFKDIRDVIDELEKEAIVKHLQNNVN